MATKKKPAEPSGTLDSLIYIYIYIERERYIFFVLFFFLPDPDSGNVLWVYVKIQKQIFQDVRANILRYKNTCAILKRFHKSRFSIGFVDKSKNFLIKEN